MIALLGRPSTLYIYPTKLKVNSIYLSKLRDSASAISKLNIMTFNELESKLLLDIILEKRIISNTENLIILRQIVREYYKDKDNGYFNNIVDFNGFYRSLQYLFDELMLGMIGATEFSLVVDSLNWKGHEKYAELVDIYSYYNAFLAKKGLIHPYNTIPFIIDKIKKSGYEGFNVLKGIQRIEFYDIYNFTPQRFELILALGRYIEIKISYQILEDNHRLFRYMNKKIELFEELGGDAGYIELEFEDGKGIDVSTLPFGTNGSSSEYQTKIKAVLDFLYSEDAVYPPDSLLPASTSISISAFNTPHEEIRYVSREVCRLIKEGVQPYEIGIFFRDRCRYAQVISHNFKKLDIPFYMRDSLLLSSFPLYKTILSIFRIIESGYSRNDLVEFITSSYISIKHPLNNPDNTDISIEIGKEKLAKYILLADIMGGQADAWDKRLTAMAEDGGFSKDEIRELEYVRGCITTLFSMLDRFAKDKKIKDFIDEFISIIKTIGVFNNIIAMPHEVGYIQRDIASLQHLMTILNEIRGLTENLHIEDKIISLADFKDIFITAVEDTPISLLHTDTNSHNKNRVQVLNLYDAFGISFRYIFICGVEKGAFPPSNIQHPIFKDNERILFNNRFLELYIRELSYKKRGRQVFSLSAEKRDEDIFLFYKVLSTASEKIHISFCLNPGTEGRLNLSPYIEEMLERLGLTLYSFEGDKALTLKYDSDINKEGLLINSSLRWFIKNCEIQRVRDRFFMEGDYIERSRASNIYTGRFETDTAKDYLIRRISTPNIIWNATKLEEYANCPFRFFMKNILYISKSLVPVIEIDKIDEGIVVHKILERFFSSRRESGLFPLKDDEESRADMLAVAEAVFNEQSIAGERNLWEVSKRRIKRNMLNILRYEAGVHNGFTPVFFEISFGSTGCNMPPLLLYGIDGTSIQFSGRIDRIDIKDDKLQVIDYKYSANEQRYRRLLAFEAIGREGFQIPIYMLAAERYVKTKTGKETQAVKGSYLLLKREVKLINTQLSEDIIETYLKGGNRDAEPLLNKGQGTHKKDRARRFSDEAIDITKRIISGDFSITPIDCSFCEYRCVCRFVEINIEYR